MGAASIAIIALIAAIARADDAVDANAEHTASEANLESNAPRQGVTFAAALGGGLILGDGTGDPVTTLALRLGETATANDVLDLELIGGTYFRYLGTDRLTDTSTSLLVGDQHYVAPAFWVRLAAGANVHTVDNGPMGTSTRAGPAGAFGLGLDVVRRHLFVIGIESLGILAIERGGLLLTSALGLNVAYY